MTLPSSPPINLVQILTEAGIGGTGYFAATQVLSLAGHGLPINMLEFLGKSLYFQYVYTLPTGTYATNLNLGDAMRAQGWDGTTNVNAIVTINGVLGSTTTGAYAFDTGLITNGFGNIITIIVNPGGYITGKGGDAIGGGGGPAMDFQIYCYLINNGIIQSGGNAGGNNDSGGGAGYYGGTHEGTGQDGSLNGGGAGGYNSAPKSPNGSPGGGPGAGVAISGISLVTYSGVGQIKGSQIL